MRRKTFRKIFNAHNLTPTGTSLMLHLSQVMHRFIKLFVTLVSSCVFLFFGAIRLGILVKR